MKQREQWLANYKRQIDKLELEIKRIKAEEALLQGQIIETEKELEYIRSLKEYIANL